METNTRYWITVVSKDHLVNGIAGGFMQANHGKAGPLKRIQKNDWIIFYSPKQTYAGSVPCQAFTAIGRAVDDDVYQHKMSEDFVPYRRNVEFYQCRDTPIAPLVNDLDFITNKKSWGYPFRVGFFEIQADDFELIRFEMIKYPLATLNNNQIIIKSTCYDKHQFENIARY
ncbi:EVE domain-containing protein [Mucilaginibacter sp. dw_454]|uniref:EVE domain-containing protein n=1 Tax=Mucilaginibacter sp. dw_454 TaxID=2720079 RepID=UPI001BD50DD1|nr:EVE domain-containing protein [Mucilaginibacter sp. dw_454]